MGFHKKKEEETNKKKSPPQTCRQHLVKHILAEPSFSRGELTRADKKYIINRCLARADKEIAVEQKDIVCAKCLFSTNFQCIVLACINNITLQIKMLNKQKINCFSHHIFS